MITTHFSCAQLLLAGLLAPKGPQVNGNYSALMRFIDFHTFFK
jgi:hypothetical protein